MTGVELFGVLALMGYFVMNGVLVVKLNHESRVKNSRKAASKKRGRRKVKRAVIYAE